MLVQCWYRKIICQGCYCSTQCFGNSDAVYSQLYTPKTRCSTISFLTARMMVRKMHPVSLAKFTCCKNACADLHMFTASAYAAGAPVNPLQYQVAHFYNMMNQVIPAARWVARPLSS